MHCTCCCVERTRVEQQETVLSGRDHGKFGKPNVVAYRHSNLAVFGEVDDGDLVAGRKHFALVEGDLARDIDIKQVDFPVSANELATGIEGQRCVVMLLRLCSIFRYAPAYEVGLCLFGKLGQRVEGGRLLFRWRRRK